MDSRMTFGEWVRWRRKGLDLTQDSLARQAGCSAVTIRKIEAGERRPSRELALALGYALQIPLREQQAFVQFARSNNRPTDFHLPAWRPDTPTWRTDQMPSLPPETRRHDEVSLSVEYELVALDKPEVFSVNQQDQLVRLVATGQVTGDLEGSLSVRIAQLIHAKPAGVDMSHAVSMPIGVFFDIAVGDETIAGAYTATYTPVVDAAGNGYGRSVGSGHVISVTAGFHYLLLSPVFVEESVKLVEGMGTGSKGTLLFEPWMRRTV